MFLLISSFCNISFPCVWSSAHSGWFRFSINHSFNLKTVTFQMQMIGNVSVSALNVCFVRLIFSASSHSTSSV